MRHAIRDFGAVDNLDKAVLTELERQNGAIETSDDLKLNAVAIDAQCGMIMSVYASPADPETKIWVQNSSRRGEDIGDRQYRGSPNWAYMTIWANATFILWLLKAACNPIFS